MSEVGMTVVRRVGAGILALTLVILSAGCPEGGDKQAFHNPAPDDNWVCNVSRDSVAETLSAHGEFVAVGETSTRTMAVDVDPRTRHRTYTATLIYELEGGAGANASFGTKVGKWLEPLGPSADAVLEGTAGIGFTYLRDRREAAEKLLDDKKPDDHWDRMIITLGARATGSAHVLPGDLPGQVVVESDAKGYLVLARDGSFSITRLLSARLDGKGPRWLMKRLGVRDGEVARGWKGRFSIAYETMFDSAGNPVRLITVVGTQRDTKLSEATRIVNLRKKRSRGNMDGAMRQVLAQPLLGVAPDMIFFPRQGGRLWSELDRAETTVSQTYDVTSDVADYPLALGPFGVAYRNEKMSRKLVESHVHSGGGEQDLTCSGDPAVPAPPKKTGTKKYHTISTTDVPAPERVDADPSGPSPVPEPSSVPSPETIGSGPPQPTPTTEAPAPLPLPGEV